MEYLDIDTLVPLQHSLASLTGVFLALYNEKGALVIPPVNENKLLASLRERPQGREELGNYIQGAIKKSLLRTDVTLSKGPGELTYFFMPVRVEGSVLVLVGGGIFASASDRDVLMKSSGAGYGFTTEQLNVLTQGIAIKEREELQNTARMVCGIFGHGLRNSARTIFLEKRYRLIKTIFSIISDMQEEKEAGAIYDTMLDMVLFLFNVETAAVLTRHGSVWRAIKTAGKYRDYLSSVNFNTSGAISDVLEKRVPLCTESVMDLLHLGLDERITSICLFPLLAEESVLGIFCVLNTTLSSDDTDVIFEACRMMGCALQIVQLRETYRSCEKEIDVLKHAASRLIPVKDPDMLYETILDMSVRLTEAEKGSLMLLSEDTSFLTVKAARGINRRLVSDIKVRAGEGIAGWVFKEGVPLIMDDIEKNEWGFPKRYKYRTNSFISIPLKLGDKTIGVLNISDKISGSVFSNKDMELITSFAAYATIALERSTYYSLAGHLKELSVTDSLTGLFNRRYFEERFFEELNRSDRYNLTFSLSMIDIDDFKLFNDSEGHLAGDEILKAIAHIAKDCLRVSDVIARFGGEEFAVIMPQTEKEEAVLVSERIRKSIREQIPCTWKTFPKKAITVSIGIATFPYDGKERKELIRNADKALYIAKMEGKDRTVVWQQKG